MSGGLPSPVLEARGLSFGYEGQGRNLAGRTISEGLDLALYPGEFVCLLGPNGAGKSTLIRTLAGMQKSLAGSIEISGTVLEEMNPKQKARAVSVVLTDSSTFGMFDGYALVALGRHPHTSWSGNLTKNDKERIEWSLEAVGGQSLARRQVSELSDGERQKLMIARALAQESRLMLLDEPTAFLDLPRRVELMKTLRDLAREQQLAILLSTHDLDLALRSADKLWLMGPQGRCVTGIPESLALSGDLAEAFASGEVDWDADHGSFRMHRESCATVSLTGVGQAAMWTKRALARVGYEVLDTGKNGDVHVEIGVENGETFWSFETPAEQKRFASLGAMVDFLRGR